VSSGVGLVLVRETAACCRGSRLCGGFERLFFLFCVLGMFVWWEFVRGVLFISYVG